MPHFTFITTIRNCVYLEQVEADCIEAALRNAIGRLPYDDGQDPVDAEIGWLYQVAKGTVGVTLYPVAGCKNTWLWREGAEYEPQYLVYGIQTDMTDTA